MGKTSGLTDRQRRFVKEYLIDANASKAAVRAGYSEKTASRIGPELLGKPWVRAEIDKGQSQRAQKLEITAERVIEELARVAMADPRKLFREDGSPKPVQELDDHTAAALSRVKVRAIPGSEAQVLEYRLIDKNQALDKLMKHVGGYKADNEQRGMFGTLDRDTLKALREQVKAAEQRAEQTSVNKGSDAAGSRPELH
ncbi:terminase small subunit [Halorhodospira sp. 9621]|uniref:terminase small subunit n=1 Tax=Halorhodospira sp. 9621 TaxID=2899135 RepID=UPI001EE95AD2|nr:terminase small subunit [Halorhodospira sp. 9621]MCG5533114.1 terminase small subunit [Halorhodospira sp. 9621]